MAAITATLIGLALAGGLTAGTKLAQSKQQSATPSTPGPTPTPALAGPPQTNSSESNAAGAAANAAKRQKKRAAAGDTLLTGGGKFPQDFPAAGNAKPATLIGS